ncbi:MAG: hypothetical protein MI717_10710 [Spirochaetales bacterium]|nr:hypothetical protein [Spirochaetales bacterium]
MSIADIEQQLTGGESVYCINQAQMARTQGILTEDSENGRALRLALEELEARYDRNQRAALAFALIERLNGSVPEKPM